jgi:phosphoglycolate phosphatase
MKKYQAVMFDLDGTLADTLADIAAAGNHALATLGRPTHPVPRYRYLAGQGLESLMVEALGPAHRDLVEQGMDLFRAYYQDHADELTRPYAGVTQLLDALRERGLKLAVLSNKPEVFTKQMMARLFAKWKFDAVRGARDDLPLKPDPAGANTIVHSLGIPKERWLYVGDTKVDMLTARAAGFTAVGVLWGFRDEAELRENGADHLIADPLQLTALLD